MAARIAGDGKGEAISRVASGHSRVKFWHAVAVVVAAMGWAALTLQVCFNESLLDSLEALSRACLVVQNR